MHTLFLLVRAAPLEGPPSVVMGSGRERETHPVCGSRMTFSRQGSTSCDQKSSNYETNLGSLQIAHCHPLAVRGRREPGAKGEKSPAATPRS